MSKETELKKLYNLRDDLKEVQELERVIDENNKKNDSYQDSINNKEEYVLNNGKYTNNKDDLEKQYKEELANKCEVDDIGDILWGLINFRFWKLGLFIVMMILFVVIGEVVIQGMIDKNPLLETDPTFEDKGVKAVAIGIVLIIVSINVVPVIIRLIVRSIKLKRLNEFKLNKKQLDQLALAEKTDKENTEYNQKIIDKEKSVFIKKRDEHIVELQEKVEKISLENKKTFEKINKLKDSIEKNDSVGKPEKNIDVVSMLVYFLETKRADSIKEALHEYDKLVANQQLLLIEQEKMLLQQKAIEQESFDRHEKMEQDKRHQERLESQLYDNARTNEKIAKEAEMIGYNTYYGNKNK